MRRVAPYRPYQSLVECYALRQERIPIWVISCQGPASYFVSENCSELQIRQWLISRLMVNCVCMRVCVCTLKKMTFLCVEKKYFICLLFVSFLSFEGSTLNWHLYNWSEFLWGLLMGFHIFSFQIFSFHYFNSTSWMIYINAFLGTLVFYWNGCYV